MMRKWLLTSFVLLSVGPALALEGDRLVTAGEHKGYSRIVLNKGVADVRVEQKGRTVRLYDIKQPQTLNLYEVNERRKAHRIISAKKPNTENGGFVEITLNCDCAIRPKTLSNGKFILDIVDPGIIDTNPLPQISETASALEPKGIISDEDKLSVEEAHDRMLALLTQAADDGLVSIRGSGNRAKGDAKKTASELEKLNLTTGGKTQNLLLPNLGRSKKVAAVPPPPEEEELLLGISDSKDIHFYECFEDADFKISNEDFEAEPLVRITELQTELAEAELPESAAIATELASGFLSIGFGDEAVAVLTTHGAQDTLFADLGRIVAQRPLASDSQLLKAKNCLGAHALWQATAKGSEEASRLLSQSGKSIETLPQRLRGMIATRLAAKMIVAQDWKTAKQFFDIANIDPDFAGSELKYVAAKLQEHEGDFDGSRETLLEIASENTTASKDALLALAKTYNEEDVPFHDGFIEDIGALAKVDGDLHASLTEALAWAKLGNIEAAMLLLRNEALKSPGNVQYVKNAARTIMRHAFEEDDGLTYISALEALIHNRSWMPIAEEAPDLVQLIAKRSAGLGLPNLAYDVLDSREPDSVTYTYQMADTARYAGDLNKAIELAAPYTDRVEFGALVANAQIQKQQYFEAIATAAALKDRQQKAAITARAAWRARDWASAAKAFQNIDPSTMSKDVALRYTFAAQKTAEPDLPSTADAILAQESEALLKGAQSLFSLPPQGSVLNRSRQTVDETADEISLYQEVLSNG